MRFLSTLVASTLGVFIAVFLLFFFGILFLFAVAAASDPAPSVRSGSVLTLTLEGPIPEVAADDPLGQALGGAPAYDLYDLMRAVDRAAADDRVDALWIQAKQVSGSWATLEEMRRALLRFKASGKPIYASTDDYLTNETAYYVTSVADSVFAVPEAIFEFNGFALTGEFYAEALEKLNVEPKVIRAGTFKSAVEPYTRTDFSPENEQQLEEILQTWNRYFMEAVADARGRTADHWQRVASDAPVLSARAALDAGLLDGLLYADEIEALLRARTGLEADDDLRTVSMEQYARVSDEDAGLDIGDGGTIAVVYAVGAIMSGESGFSANPLLGGEMVGTETFVDAMDRARERDDIDAIVLRIDSPGGFAPAADAMLQAVERAAAEKPVVVSMGGAAASGGYWLAMGGHEIVASPLTLTGSIGAFSVFFNARGLFSDKLGITFDQIETSPYADVYSLITDLEPAERALLQRQIDELYASFVATVAEGRPKLTVEEVDAIAQGRVWTGVAAEEVGLVDALGGLGEALERAAARADIEPGDYDVTILPRPKTFLEEFTESMNARAAEAWTALRTPAAERTLLEEARRLSALADLHAKPYALMPWRIEVR